MEFGRLKNELKGIFSILLGIFCLVSLITYSPQDPSIFTYSERPVHNYGGIIGANLSDILFSLFGFPSLTIPFLLIIWGLRRLLHRKGHIIYIAGSLLFILSLSIISGLVERTIALDSDNSIGGMAGFIMSRALQTMFSTFGAYILSFLLFISSVIMMTPVAVFSIGIKTSRYKEKGPDETELEEEFDTVQEEDFSPAIVTTEGIKEEVQYTPGRKVGEYEFPPLDLLVIHDQSNQKPAKEEILSLSQNIERKLADFDVEGKVTQVHPGPVVTMFEFEPAPGIKINKIISLADDLSLALKAQSVRIYTVPGKSTIGIEVPNRQREIVSLREIIGSEVFQRSNSKLTLALGKDITGNPFVIDLAKTPHLLVAGATGSGKSVSLNSMIISILYKATPREVKLLMIDPKFLELSPYNEIPHLLSPVITTPKDARDALKKIVLEMERRYRIIAEKGVRNIEGFNAQVHDEERLPYIVVIIDELADLMLTGAQEVEDAITRLAHMARASGIHLIIATQRPSVDVITGIIKANFPARIAFQVTSKIDSRTILDAQGAEQLLGQGDMLFMMPGVKLKRIHGSYVSEDEIRSIVDFIKPQAEPDYTIMNSIELPSDSQEQAGEEGTDSDELYEKVIELGETLGEISISLIQRRFKIGFNRAARLMELLERDGFVGPPKGAGKPRDFIRRKR
ncbi:MAG: DNA translocase FtsK [Thermodesulfovibrionales bacterium]